MTLVAHFPLHEDSGTTAYNIKGSTDATHNGVTLGQAGILGVTAPDYDGTDDYTILSTTTVDGETSASVCGWANITQNGASGGIFGHRLNLNSDGGGITIRTNPSDEIVIYLNGNDGGSNPNIIYTPGPSFWDSWRHIAGVWDGTTLYLYIDGQKVASTSASISSLSDLGVFEIGRYRWDDQGDTYYEPQKANDVRIYNHALTAQEVQYLYGVVAGNSRLQTKFKGV